MKITTTDKIITRLIKRGGDLQYATRVVRNIKVEDIPETVDMEVLHNVLAEALRDYSRLA